MNTPEAHYFPFRRKLTRNFLFNNRCKFINTHKVPYNQYNDSLLNIRCLLNEQCIGHEYKCLIT